MRFAPVASAISGTLICSTINSRQDTIYRSTDWAQVFEALDQYDARYVVVGPHERSAERYSLAAPDMARYEEWFGPPAFESGDIALFAVPR